MYPVLKKCGKGNMGSSISINNPSSSASRTERRAAGFI
jgi:hypothetical protein